MHPRPLDNCVDGILRSKAAKPAREKKITIRRLLGRNLLSTKNTFQFLIIAENPMELHPYAFTMGRDSDPSPSRCDRNRRVYGIGMKRAIFKMGRQASYPLRNDMDAYDV